MAMITQQSEVRTGYILSLNIPADRDAYRAFVAGLDGRTRALLFGVRASSTIFRCPTNGRQYEDKTPRRIGDALWTRCTWCDTHGRVRGVDPDFDRSAGQPHCYAIMEADDA